MKRFGLLLLLSSFFVPMTPARLVAQEAPFKILLPASLEMLGWFKLLLGSFEALAEKEDRRRLIEDLSSLADAIYDLEQNKRTLLSQLKRSRPNRRIMMASDEDSMQSLFRARDALRRSGSALREQFQLQGVTIERRLSDATLEKEVWLLDARLAIESQADKGDLVLRGQELVDALAAAHAELLKLIAALKSA